MPIALILLAVFLVIGILALVMSSKTWRWYQITLTAFIMLFSVVWFYLAARTLKTQEAWRKEVKLYQAEIAKEKALGKKILEGGEDAEGKPHQPLEQLKTEVAKYLQGRGRVWDKVVRVSIGRDGVINATVDKPEGLEKNLVVWVFDEGPASAGNRQLGMFEVTEVNGNAVKLAPALKLRPAELARIAQPKNTPLVLHEIMPTDAPELNDELVKAFPDKVPAAVRQEYEKDGKPPLAGEKRTDRIWQRVKALKDISVELTSEEAKELQARATPQDPPLETDVAKNELKIPVGGILLLDPKSAAERIAAGEVEPAKGDAETAPSEEGAPTPPSDKVYVRELRDYAQLWRDLNLQIESVLRSSAEVDSQNATVKESQAKVDQDIAYRNTEKVKFTADEAHFRSDLAIIQKHVAAMQTAVAGLRQQVKAMIAENRQKADEMAAQVHDAADRINRQSATATTR